MTRSPEGLLLRLMQWPVQERGGVHLKDTSLWVDADHAQPLCVLTSLDDRLPPTHRRVVASAQLAQALEQARYEAQVLPAPFRRWVSIGGQPLQLLDAATRAGFSAVRSRVRGLDTIVAGPLRRQDVLWPQADCLVADLWALGHEGLSVSAVVERLLERMGTVAERGVCLWVDTIDAAWELFEVLREKGQSIRPKGLLGPLLGPAARERTPHRLLLSSDNAKDLPIDGRHIHVDLGLRRRPPHCDETLALAWFADAAALKRRIQQCAPRYAFLRGVPEATYASLRRQLRDVNIRFAPMRMNVTPPRQLDFFGAVRDGV